MAFQRIGGGARGALGGWGSWLLAILACAGIAASIYLSRRRRQRYRLAVRPLWLDVGLAGVGCAVVIAGVVTRSAASALESTAAETTSSS